MQLWNKCHSPQAEGCKAQAVARLAACLATCLAVDGVDRLGCCIARSGRLYRARSRLYRNEILQVNMHSKALAEIYTMHSFALL